MSNSGKKKYLIALCYYFVLSGLFSISTYYLGLTSFPIAFQTAAHTFAGNILTSMDEDVLEKDPILFFSAGSAVRAGGCGTERRLPGNRG
jgi:hypothetical protein